MKIRLVPELLAKLADMATQRRVSSQVLAEAFVTHAVTGIAAEPPKDRPIGRPVQNDLPLHVERSPIASGFTGIYPRGTRWLARWLHEELGLFSSPELAAIARYWFEQGRRSVARDSLVATGTPRDEAVRLSRFKGVGEPIPEAVVSGTGDSAAVGEVPVAPRRRGRPRKATAVAVEDRQDHVERMVVDYGELSGTPGATAQDVFNRSQRLAAHTAITEATRATSTDVNGGGPLDTTYSEPPEDVGSAPGGEAPVPSPRSLRWGAAFRQQPPPPKPGSDPGEKVETDEEPEHRRDHEREELY